MSLQKNGNLVSLTTDESKVAIDAFVKILQFPTVSTTAPTTGAYADCAKFLLQQLNGIKCLDRVHILPESPDHSPVVVARWKGKDETLPVLLLNSHYDVVPAGEWTKPPFDGLITDDGRIYGRGAQDMKCVCIQYMEAIRKLSAEINFQPVRSIYLTFVPDEETTGGGMACFLDSQLFKSELPGISLALDEGLASTSNGYSLFYGERLPWLVTFEARGNTGHGSRFIEDTAVEQIVDVAKKALEFRTGQRDMLHGNNHSNCSHAVAAKKVLGDVTSLNITTLQAGVKAGESYVHNVVPPSATCGMDVRISPHVEPAEISNMLNNWCRECSTGTGTVSWDFTGGDSELIGKKHALTDISSQNPWYDVFVGVLKDHGIESETQVFPAATDSRLLRALGIRAFGFSPMRNSEILLHENDEYLDRDVFLEGITVYVALLKALALKESMD